jgi:hypothetical protein
MLFLTEITMNIDCIEKCEHNRVKSKQKTQTNHKNILSQNNQVNLHQWKLQYNCHQLVDAIDNIDRVESC